MAKKLTTADVKARIQERRALAEAKKRVEERRARLNERTTARKPLTERKVNPVARPVMLERTAAPIKRTETLQENIAKRNRAAKINADQARVYNVLAENIYSAAKNLTEATQAHPNALNNQAGVGLVQTFFDIFYGYFPNLVLPLLASVQPMKTEQGYIFYMEFTAGNDKGLLTKGEVLMSPFKVNSQYEYTAETINLGDAVALIEKPIWGPMKPNSLKVTDHLVEFTGPGAFAVKELDGTPVTTGTVVADEVNIKVTLAAPITGAQVTYEYNNAFAPTAVPGLGTNIERLPIVAKYRTIKTNYAFTAAFGFEAEHGANLGDKLAEAAMEQLKRETDLEGIAAIFNAAPEQIVWNRNAGFAVGGYQDHKLSFLDAIVQAANRIFAKSKRVRGNVLIVGIDAMTILQTVPFFKPVAGFGVGDNLNGGGGLIGHIQNMPVIAVPDIPHNEWAVIFKDVKDNLNAGLVFAPYIPVFATEPVTLDDLMIRRAFITAYAIKVVNPDYFIKGRIINDPTALPVYLISKDGTDTALGEIGEDAILDFFNVE